MAKWSKCTEHENNTIMEMDCMDAAALLDILHLNISRCNDWLHTVLAISHTLMYGHTSTYVKTDRILIMYKSRFSFLRLYYLYYYIIVCKPIKNAYIKYGMCLYKMCLQIKTTYMEHMWGN